MVGLGRLRRRASGLWRSALCWLPCSIRLRRAGKRQLAVPLRDRGPVAAMEEKRPGTRPYLAWTKFGSRVRRWSRGTREILAGHPHFTERNTTLASRLACWPARFVGWMGDSRVEATGL